MNNQIQIPMLKYYFLQFTCGNFSTIVFQQMSILI